MALPRRTLVGLMLLLLGCAPATAGSAAAPSAPPRPGPPATRDAAEPPPRCTRRRRHPANRPRRACRAAGPAPDRGGSPRRPGRPWW